MTKVKQKIEKPEADRATHYVDKKLMLQEITIYRDQYLIWVGNGKEGKRPSMSEKLGEMILEICTRVSFAPNFINYTFREDMIGPAVENCILYAHNFDYTKYNNPFGYLTTFAYFSNVRCINQFKDDRKLKAKYVQRLCLDDDMLEQMGDVGSYSDTGVDTDNNSLIDLIKDYYKVDLVAADKPKPKKVVEIEPEIEPEIRENIGLISLMFEDEEPTID